MLCQWSVLFRLCCLNNQLNWHDELLAVLCELQRHEFVSQCCLSNLCFSVVCRCLCRLLTAYSLCWPSHSQSAQRDGHALACCCGICFPGSQPAEGPTDSLDTMPFPFEYGLSSFAKLMCQADFSCPGENLLVGPCFLWTWLTSACFVSSAIISSLCTHPLFGQGDELDFPQIGRASTENQTKLDRKFGTHCSRKTTC